MQRLDLSSNGRTNSLWGTGRLDAAAPGKEPVDRCRYDPLNPVPTVGGGDCCNGGIVVPGAFDQRSVEARDDVLVYTSEPLEKAMEVSGFIDTVLQISSIARDPDFAVKIVEERKSGV